MTRSNIPLRNWLIGLLTVVLLTACGGKQTAEFKSTDITGADFGQDFHLTDHNGKPRKLADFRGKVVMMFFGYTHCPDVCPTTLTEMALLIKQLGKAGEKVQVLFVTVDPARDTPELLAQYMPAFNPGFLGLYGDEAATAKVAKDFHIFYQKQPSADGKRYTIDHSAGTYVFDKNGRLRLFMRYGQNLDDIEHDVKILLSS
ncbi:SCO family protein [Sulfurirhabdus autotrophica]|uniref:Protein SCO1/2 n=1 Tax=Sulfurirhabdus autotrophica TaxID=1706046 RepID=A0A4R3Y0I8_9PROT|nr:SCO family protein [Sulfurirhabdus autotrophica]TCV84751.1 protein SCO1/2 [Sulfurirhabdus autotrophica]